MRISDRLYSRSAPSEGDNEGRRGRGGECSCEPGRVRKRAATEASAHASTDQSEGASLFNQQGTQRSDPEEPSCLNDPYRGLLVRSPEFRQASSPSISYCQPLFHSALPIVRAHAAPACRICLPWALYGILIRLCCLCHHIAPAFVLLLPGL